MTKRSPRSTNAARPRASCRRSRARTRSRARNVGRRRTRARGSSSGFRAAATRICRSSRSTRLERRAAMSLEPRARIRNAIESADGPALVAFMTGGFPAPGRFLDDLRTVAEVADAIEIGVPFSDPMADGVTVQRSSRSAIEHGVTLRWILDELARRDAELGAPVLLMSYLNPLLALGYETLAARAVDAGVDGFIVPDLPYEESG